MQDSLQRPDGHKWVVADGQGFHNNKVTKTPSFNSDWSEDDGFRDHDFDSDAASDFSVGDDEDYPAMVWNQDTKPKGISQREATFSFITAIIGAGIMALPQMPARAGLYPCIIFTILSVVAVAESSGAYFKGYMAWTMTHKNGNDLATFEDFGKAAFGRAGAWLVRSMQIGWFLGVCSGYVILMSKQLMFISGSDWSNQKWIFVLSPVLWFLCMMRDLSALASLMPVGAIAAVCSCTFLIMQANNDQNVWANWTPEQQAAIHSYWPPDGLMPLGSSVAKLLGAFGVMGNVPPVLDEMRSKRRLPQALRTALFAVLVLYGLIIVNGYWCYGNFIQGNIIVSMSKSPGNFDEAFNLPPEQWTGRETRMLAMMMSWCVLINLAMSYPLLMLCVFASVQGMSCSQPALKAGSIGNYIMRSSFVAITVFIGLSVPNFGIVFSLFASVCGPVQGIFIPIIFGARIRCKVGAKGSSAFRWFIHGLILLLGLFTLIVGLTDSIKGLTDYLSG